jgi:TrmH family RNA methyltransferase
MLTKNEIKYIQSLYHKKQREEDKVFVAEGPKLAEELLKSDFEVLNVYATHEWLQNQKSINAKVTEVSAIELERISNLQTANEVVVIAKQKEVAGEPILQDTITLVLDGIQDPGNMGTIIRIADWFGVSQLVCSIDCVDVYNPKVVQSTMGSITRVNCWYQDLSAWQLQEGIPVYGALLEGKNIFDTGKISEGLLVIGNESKGIRQPFIDRITHPLTIPKIGGAESLNAAVATGIILGCMTMSR